MIRSNDVYVAAREPINKSEAVSRMKAKKDVYSKNESCAKSVAKSAGSDKTPVGPEKDKTGGDGYYMHYHVNGRKYGSHSFFIR